MRKLMLAALALSLLVAPAAAGAAPYIRSYKVRDTGARIVHTIRWCTGYLAPGYEYRGRWNTRVEREDGTDPRFGWSVGWHDRGCWVRTLSRYDDLRYEDWYWGRVRLRFNGTTIYTPWKQFWSS